MRKYELTVLVHPDLEVDLEKPMGVVRDIVTKNKGSIISEDNWGKKKLAYPIARENFAVYVYMDVELPAEAVAKVDQTLNITDGVIRHLLVSVDEKVRAAQAEAREKGVEKEEE